MKMLKAMRKCTPGGYVARKAYPNRKYYKDQNGIFMEAALVDHIDFIATDWENYPLECRYPEPSIHPKKAGKTEKGVTALPENVGVKVRKSPVPNRTIGRLGEDLRKKMVFDPAIGKPLES